MLRCQPNHNQAREGQAMTAEMKSSGGGVGVILCLTIASYAAGTASASDPMTVPRLNSAIDMMTKARALLDAASPSTRMGVADLSTAKQALDKALDQTRKAVKAEDG
jgi:hypothetical protein